MSTQNKMSLVVAHSFDKADRLVANSFDYEDGALERKRLAIAMNLIAIAAETGLTLKHMWTNNMLDDGGKINMINGLKERNTTDADDALRDVWDHMDEDHKQLHLENHPDSMFHSIEQHKKDAQEQHQNSEVEESVRHEEAHQELRERHEKRNRKKHRAEKKRGQEPEGDDDWWNQMSMAEQRKYLRAHPKSKKARRWRIGVRNASMKVAGKIHEEVRKMGHDYKNGMAGLRNLRNGKKMTDEQKDALKKTAKRVAVLTIAALGAMAMFTPLGPFALEVGEKYFNGFEKRGTELANEHLPKQSGGDGTNSGVGNPTTVGQTGDAANGIRPGDTTVGQVSQSGTNLHRHLKSSKKQEAHQDEVELDWMRRDFTEWLMKTDTHKLMKEINGK